MTDAFFALDEDWRFTYLNERGRDVINRAADGDRSVDELLGANIWTVVPDAVGTQFEAEYRQAMADQTPRSFEAHYEPMATWFEVRAYPSPSGLSVYLHDVTGRHEREAAMAERERVLEEMYRVVSEKETSFEQKVEHMLQVGRDVLGTDCAALSSVEGDDYIFDVVYDPDGDTEPGDVVPLESTNCERAIVTEETLVLADIATEAPDLTERGGFTEQGIACYLGTPVYVDGSVTGTFCFYDRDARTEPFSDWDVTLVELMGNWVSYERERQRREAELTRERNRLDDFASLVSHDLRNPLNLAVGRLELASEEYDGDSVHLEAIEGALERMETLIDDLLVLARSGDHVVDATRVDVGTVVTAAWEMAGSDAGRVSVDDDIATIEGDSDRLQQLFENCFRNSVEHGRPDVRVRVGPLAEHDGFYVADDGPGIPADEREQVVESGYTTSETGTGFGLSIIDEIVDAHGGEFRITESASGGVRLEVSGVAVR
ncbi:ATP-binding protein [Halomicroarcula sp. GCM10025710]